MDQQQACISINKINKFIQCFKTVTNNIVNYMIKMMKYHIFYVSTMAICSIITSQQITELTTSKKTELLIYGYIFSCVSSVSNFNGSVPTINSLINQHMPAINSCDSMQNLSMINLPFGVRYNAAQFANWRDDKLIRKQQILMNNNIKKSRYQQLKKYSNWL